MAIITITISPSGSSKTKVTGVQGKSCQALTMGLESNLGNLTERRLTAEAYAVSDVQQKVRQTV